MRLTDTSVRALPLPDKGQRTYWDQTLTGFGCRISQGGTRSFVLQFGDERERQLITIGRYHPDILPLAKARSEAKKLLAEQVLGKHRAKAMPFDTAKDTFLAECRKKNKPKTVYNYEKLLDRYFTFGKPVGDITTADITRKLDKIDADSQHEHALVLAKIFFKWAYKKGWLDASPADRLQTKKQKARTRVLSDAELILIWRACDASVAQSEERSFETGEVGGSIPSQGTKIPANYATIIKLLILAGQRRNEIASLRTSWLEEDRAELPGEITKNKLEHVVYLSPLARRLCSEAADAATATTRENDTLLFPGVRRGKVFSAWSQAKKDLDTLSGVTGWTHHDLRRTFSTRMNAFTLPHVVERHINHVDGVVKGVGRIYNRYEYAEERKAAVAEWERRLLAIVTAEA